MLDFVHRENIRRFEKALADCKDSQERATLLQLIAEEKAKLEEALRLMQASPAEADSAQAPRK